ncbi:MAG: pyrroline-5-carboxylate reductase [Lachnospiraceae bacterium]|nr:pyrroline-5-carboxylate reductase [Lachnospiraceae bacterium]
MSTFTTIGFIGSGNMSSALAHIIAEAVPRLPMVLSNRTHAKAQALAATLPKAEAVTNPQVATNADLIFLGVKPQFMEDALSSIREVLAAKRAAGQPFTLVTMAAGLTMDTIRSMVGGEGDPIIRIMPNTPISVGAGVIQYCSKGVSPEALAEFADLLKGAGTVDEIPENLIDAAAAVSGCGPAFMYMFIEALADGAVACGLPRAKALAYAAQMAEGAGRLAKLSDKHPGTLKDEVTSPGGTTIQGVRILEERGMRGAAMDAVIAAYDKTMELKNRS